MLNGKVVLITGGTGSFGKAFVKEAMSNFNIRKIIIFSRDELKQYEMKKIYNDPKVSYFLGDVRDKQRLHRAFDGVDYVVHAAALKHVPSSEYNPFEAIKTNVIGAENVINAAIDKGVKRVIALSTDKAANPINLYGATKLCSDKLFTAGNAYAGGKETKFGVVRYGNVVGSRGSVIPFFMEERKKGVLPITDKRMTRFWITLEKCVQFVLKCMDIMLGGEIFVPKIPSMKIVDLARAIAPECKLEYVGIRPGEKLHEVMITEDDARNTLDCKDYYVIIPMYDWWENKNESYMQNAKSLEEGFIYSSERNQSWMKEKNISQMINKLKENNNDGY